jgi:hypothetical protein
MEKVSVSQFPQHLILDVEEIFWKLRADIMSTTGGMSIDWDAFFDQLFEALVMMNPSPWPPSLSYSDRALRAVVEEMAYGDTLFENSHGLTYYTGARARLFNVIYRGALLIKERLLELGAYHLGYFPYTYQAMLSDGCLYFSKNESIYDPNDLDIGHGA